MDASFRFSSEDVVKPVCEISPLGTFERRCLIPRCSSNLRQAKYTEGEQGGSRLSLYNKAEPNYDHESHCFVSLSWFVELFIHQLVVAGNRQRFHEKLLFGFGRVAKSLILRFNVNLLWSSPG
jgi:hypothetical protein